MHSIQAVATRFAEPYLRRLLWSLPPELAHDFAGSLIRLSPDLRTIVDTRLSLCLAGKSLPHPIGLAAGFDKSAKMLDGLGRLGFSFVEAGTVTPKPQSGNAKPRLFRLSGDRALINRYGFNNDGLEAFCERLRNRQRDYLVGANIGINKTSQDPFGDFVSGWLSCAPLADYVAINVSSPNTPGLRDLQEPESLERLLGLVGEVSNCTTPLFLKLSPDLEDSQLIELLNVSIEANIAGLILCNTTTGRPSTLQSSLRGESGGLSGAPLNQRSLDVLGLVSEANQGRLELISSGGISTGKDVFDRLSLGANAVQIYTSFVYHGPQLLERISRELLALMDEANIDTVGGLRARNVGAG